MSVQTVETNEVSMSLWHQEKGMETGKATLRSRAWLRGQQKVAERLMVCSQEEARDSSYSLPLLITSFSPAPRPGVCRLHPQWLHSLTEGRSLTTAPAVIQRRPTL